MQLLQETWWLTGDRRETPQKVVSTYIVGIPIFSSALNWSAASSAISFWRQQTISHGTGQFTSTSL